MPTIANNELLSSVRSKLNLTGLRKNFWTATTDPGASNNAAEGYEIGSRWINTSTRTCWTLTGFSGANAIWASDVTDWSEVTNKPTTFPPAAHQHPWSDLTGIPATFAPAAHAHAWAEITGKPTTFTPTAHSHALADVTGLSGALAGKADTGHGHNIADVSGLQSALDGKAPASSVWTLEQIQDAIAAMLQGGTHTNASVTYDDAAGTISITASGGGGGGSLTQEQVEDMVGSLVVQGTGISVVYDDPNNRLTIALTGESYTTAEKNKLAGIATGATANATDAALRDRTSHTGTQAIATVEGLQTALNAKLESTLVSSFALTLLDDTTQAAMRATLGLAALATLATVGTGQITNGAVTNVKQANMPATTIKGNSGASAAAPSDLTVSQLKTLLALAIADVSGLQSALNGKTNGAYTIWSGTQAAFNGTTPTSTTLSYITA